MAVRKRGREVVKGIRGEGENLNPTEEQIKYMLKHKEEILYMSGRGTRRLYKNMADWILSHDEG